MFGWLSSTDNAPSQAELELRKEQLAAFYQVHEPSKIPEVENLLSQYKYEDVVASLTKKYGKLPDGWGSASSEAQTKPKPKVLTAKSNRFQGTENTDGLIGGSIIEHKIASDAGGKFVRYKVQYKWESDATIQTLWMRYSQFERLWQDLKAQENYWVPDIDGKRWWGQFEVETINTRRQSLNGLLAAIISNNILDEDKVLERVFPRGKAKAKVRANKTFVVCLLF
jgi:hypothetical protein